jgi:hypothetical protein
LADKSRKLQKNPRILRNPQNWTLDLKVPDIPDIFPESLESPESPENSPEYPKLHWTTQITSEKTNHNFLLRTPNSMILDSMESLFRGSSISTENKLQNHQVHVL